MAATTAVATLGDQTFITDPVDKAWYLLRQFICTPADLSETTRGYVVSLYDLITQYENNPRTLTNAIPAVFKPVLDRYFDGSVSEVTCNYSMINDRKYSLTISLSILSNGAGYNLDRSVQIVDGNIVLANDTDLSAS